MSRMEHAQWKTSCSRSLSSTRCVPVLLRLLCAATCVNPRAPTQALDWRLTSCFTVNNWVNTMMQLGDNVSRCRGLAPLLHIVEKEEFVLPKYSGQEFIQVMTVSLFVT